MACKHKLWWSVTLFKHVHINVNMSNMVYIPQLLWKLTDVVHKKGFSPASARHECLKELTLQSAVSIITEDNPSMNLHFCFTLPTCVARWVLVGCFSLRSFWPSLPKASWQSQRCGGKAMRRASLAQLQVWTFFLFLLVEQVQIRSEKDAFVSDKLRNMKCI